MKFAGDGGGGFRNGGTGSAAEGNDVSRGIESRTSYGYDLTLWGAGRGRYGGDGGSYGKIVGSVGCWVEIVDCLEFPGVTISIRLLGDLVVTGLVCGRNVAGEGSGSAAPEGDGFGVVVILEGALVVSDFEIVYISLGLDSIDSNPINLLAIVSSRGDDSFDGGSVVISVSVRGSSG